jgi:hypothetical protein
MAANPDDVELCFCERGLAEALSRLRERISGHPEGGDPLLTLSEVLHWLYMLEERLRAVFASSYFATRDSDVDGRVVAGLIYVRGLATHVVARPAEARFRGGYGAVAFGEAPYGGGVTDWTWLPLAALPPPGRPEGYGRDAIYDQHVANRELFGPLLAASRYLTSGRMA